MTTLNISLPESMRGFIDEQVARGEFSTASEFVRHLVREAQKRQAEDKLERLLIEGLDSGEPTEMTSEDWDDLRRTLRQRVTRRKQA